MKVAKLKNMVKGWFVGSFEPTLYNTKQVEVAVKHYKKGDSDVTHYHKIATEITVIVSGKVRMNGQEFLAGDIITLSPGESTDFCVLEDNTTTTVVKIPGALNDKYLVEE